MKIKFDKFFFLGLYVLLSVVINQWINFSLFSSFPENSFGEILWFCDFTGIILGIGLILKNIKLTTLTFVMAVPAQFLWIVDFFMEVFGSGLGRTTVLWSYGPLVFWASVNLHLILIPFSFYGVWKLGFFKKALKSILIYIFLLLAFSFIFTLPNENINCVFYSCDGEDPGAGYLEYFILHSLFFWSVIAIISFYSFKLIFQKFHCRKKS
mgnify:CR=1 FL=1